MLKSVMDRWTPHVRTQTEVMGEIVIKKIEKLQYKKDNLFDLDAIN